MFYAVLALCNLSSIMLGRFYEAQFSAWIVFELNFVVIFVEVSPF